MHKQIRFFCLSGTGWRRSVVVSTLALINVANRLWAWLVFGRVTIYGWVNHLGV